MPDETITITFSERAMLALALVNGYQQRLRIEGGGPNPQIDNPQPPGEYVAGFIAASARRAVTELILAEGRGAAVEAAEKQVDADETIRVVSK